MTAPVEKPRMPLKDGVASHLPLRRNVLPGREILDQTNQAIQEAITNVLPSTVNIQILGPEFNHRTREPEEKVDGGGAGFIVESGPDEILIATNKHVVNDLRKNPQWTLNVQSSYISPDGSTRKGKDYDDAEVVYMSHEYDVAFIAISGKDHEELPAAKLGSADGLRAGQTVITIGAPYLITDTIAVGTVTHEGQIVIPTRYGRNPYVQIDAFVHPGNSGGIAFNPVTDEVVGVSTGNISKDPTSGMMIPIDVFKEELARFNEMRAAENEAMSKVQMPEEAPEGALSTIIN